MGILTFDWGQVTSFNGSPLVYPWWAAANVGINIVFFYWFLTPILYVSRPMLHVCVHFLSTPSQYTNVWQSAYLPLVSSQSFDNTGQPYNLSKIINTDGSFNIETYKAYSPLFISTTFAMCYGLSFASITALLMHTSLYHCKRIWIQTRRSLGEQPDIHARLMSVYKEVPDWWYLMVFGWCTKSCCKVRKLLIRFQVSMFMIGVITIEVWDTQLPVWAFILALVIRAFT